MLKDCVEIFAKNFQEKGERYLLDNYVPKEGTYLLIQKKEGKFVPETPFDIRYNKKEKRLEGREHGKFPLVCFLDYYSKLIEMNKPIDSSKTIHSNNYLSFAVKKESLKEKKLTEDTINTYFQVLEDPKQKYQKKKKSMELYNQVEASLDSFNHALAVEIQEWILSHIFSLDLDLEKKDYLKLFFILEDEEETKALYKQEGLRYILPNIYNSTDYNQEVDGTIYGLPNDNMGMNSKKPFLANRTRGNMELPYLLDQQEVMLQSQFFDYLMGLVSMGKYDIYFDSENGCIVGKRPGEKLDRDLTGYYMRIRKEKNEVAIQDFQPVPCHSPKLKPPFAYKAIIKIEEEDTGRILYDRGELEALIDEFFFNNCLRGNYYTEPGDLLIRDSVLLNSLLKARSKIHLWLYANDNTDVAPLLRQISQGLIISSINKGYLKKAKKQLNLRWSLHDYFAQNGEMEARMYKIEEALRNHMYSKEGTWSFSEDEEYYFAVGQMVAYFISKSKTAKKPLSFVNPFLNTKSDEKMKEEMGRLFKKYNYDINETDRRVKQLLSRIMQHKPEQPVNQEMIISGLLSDNVIFEKKEKENE